MYERDEREPSFAITKKLADFFEVDTDYLLGRTDKPTNKTVDLAKDPLDEKVDELLKDPETQVFFKDYLSAPEEKKAEMRRFMKFLIEEEEKRKTIKN
ncbi:helix-turn-helix transcriptional regulator [Anaerobacillus sp. CMMVII]|uniref:helix-turn-helix domain-containing protein n=1 Tax=Anaerobacillus sp. CMMVII TaxID=2755588 RepID=UPI0021C4D609|nr:helix-turn-helix transcriptional regulator [Anaerobacillus sp. CMMVII]